MFAGSARVDITPPAGYSTGGHGPAGSTPRGYWRPLTATALYFEDSARTGAALVSVDLFAVPSAIHQEVAEEFSNRGPQSTLSLERIVIAATHTHHGTANYLSVTVHNRRASNTEGFDSRLRNFLVQRIITAIDMAIADALRHPNFDLDIATGVLDKPLFRNRSANVFLKNTDATKILDTLAPDISGNEDDCVRYRWPGEPKKHWKMDGCPRLRAVDRNISLVRLRRNGATAAMAVFIAVHPTVLPGPTPLFSPDVFGVARDVLEHSAADSIGHVAFFNGAEGDITMRRTTRDLVDMTNLGQSLAEGLKRIHDTARARSITGNRIEGRLHFAAPGDVAPSAGVPKARLARTALGGPAALRGGEDDPGPGVALLLTRGVPRTRKPTGEHGVKVPAVRGWEWLTYMLFPKNEFPMRFPMSLVSIGDLRLATVPFEMTTAVGYAVRERLKQPHGELEIVGLANEYAMYTSSHAEYQKQDYMGAFTLWGPEQASFIAESLAELSSAPPGWTGTQPPDDPGNTNTSFGPRRLRADRGQIFEGLAPLLNTQHPPAFCWNEPAPPELPAQATRTIEILASDGSVADRLGFIVVLLGRPEAGLSRWAAIWLRPLLQQTTGTFQFKIVPEGAGPIYSRPFEATVRTADCETIPRQP